MTDDLTQKAMYAVYLEGVGSPPSFILALPQETLEWSWTRVKSTYSISANTWLEMVSHREALDLSSIVSIDIEIV